MQPFILADIGGTNSRFLIFQGKFLFHKVYQYASQNYPDFYSLLENFLKESKNYREKLGLILAVAGPVVGNKAKLTNLGWEIELPKLRKKFPLLRPILLVNDLYAGAGALTKLSPKDLFILKPGLKSRGPKAAIFCGTGLGVGLNLGHKPLKILASEAGHSLFTPLTGEEKEILFFLKDKGQELSFEEVLSGRGLTNLYETFFRQRKKPPEIVDEARSDGERALKVIHLYAEILGRFLYQVAVFYLPLGGIYLGGGLLLGLKEFFLKENFQEEILKQFLGVKKLSIFLEKIPIYLVNHPYPVLLGCVAILEDLLR